MKINMHGKYIEEKYIEKYEDEYSLFPSTVPELGSN